MGKLGNLTLESFGALIAEHGSIPKAARALGVSDVALYKRRDLLKGKPLRRDPYRSVSVRLPVEQVERVDAIAEALGDSRSSVLASYVADGLDREP